MNEIVIEWFKGENVASVTAYSGSRIKNKILKLAEKHSDVSVVENKDGSIFAHIPTDWIRIKPKRELTPEQRELAMKNILGGRK